MKVIRISFIVFVDGNAKNVEPHHERYASLWEGGGNEGSEQHVDMPRRVHVNACAPHFAE